MPLAVSAVIKNPTDDELTTLLERIERLLFVQSLRFDGPSIYSLPVHAIRLARNEESLEDISQRLHAETEKAVKGISILDSGMNASKSKIYYGWEFLRYFMFEYEQDLKNKSMSKRDKLIWEEFRREDFEADFSSIEHVYPQEARHIYWRDRFGHLNSRQKNSLRNSLGNLVALSRPKNSSLSNRPFPEKKTGSEGSPGYKMGSYSEIEIAGYSDWTPSTILERGIRLLEFLERRWGISVGDRAHKIAALRLGFVVGDAEHETDSDPDEEKDVISDES